jgi:hypothetical protein
LRALRETSNNDLTDLEALLKAAGPNRPKLIACESLYSMDGDVAPLGAVDEIALSDWIQRLPRYRFSIGPKVAEQGPVTIEASAFGSDLDRAPASRALQSENGAPDRGVTGTPRWLREVAPQAGD